MRQTEFLTHFPATLQIAFFSNDLSDKVIFFTMQTDVFLTVDCIYLEELNTHFDMDNCWISHPFTKKWCVPSPYYLRKMISNINWKEVSCPLSCEDRNWRTYFNSLHIDNSHF